MTTDPSSRSSRLPHATLAVYGIALICGSLYPLSGWRSAGVPMLGFLFDPWPRWWTVFDVVFNIAVYLPGGLLVAMLLRQGRLAALALPLAVLACSGAAVSLEALQSLLPNRVPSRLDWLANSAGALLGALLASPGERLTAASQRALEQRIAINRTDSAIGTLLLGVWLLIQWPSQRLLFGCGDILGAIVWLARLADPGASGADWRLDAVHTVFAEALGVAMAVVGVGLVVREVLPTRAPRAGVTALLLLAAAAIKTVAGAVVFGPDKALAWLTAGAQGGLLIGAVVLALLAAARRVTRLRIAIGALALASLLTTLYPFDIYYASVLTGRESGSWRNLDGLLRGAATVWPYATMLWCAQRLLRLRRTHPIIEPT
jgi:VanZ family protein